MVFSVHNTLKPISMNALGSDREPPAGLVLVSPYQKYQVLDIHTFETTQWNSSILIEFTRINMPLLNYSDDVYLFVAYQRLPGPLEEDHDFMFSLNVTRDLQSFYIASKELTNKTGLYYIGVGIRLDDVSNRTVDYSSISDMKKPWNFVRWLDFDYEPRILTKGCYYFDVEADSFNANRTSSVFSPGDQHVRCESYHLTTFSVGLFSPEIPSDFDYDYVQDMLPDEYMYMLVVETGYRMFATSNSKISFNLTGTSAEEVARCFDNDLDESNGLPFTWGKTTRFLMTTPWSLGDLTYLRLWIGNPGQEHRESWYCNRVIIKDMQTDINYYFPVHNWLGTTNGDGQAERLAEVCNKRRFLDEAMSMHNVGEIISYIAMYTGNWL
ncbi:hypothetical protein WR25_00454 [Diploscapter pachys]|uniref:PLAT domain-containing protein n=1 Tax=Diploscapter pachys TaxID=2018661 RepID=A0A2A2M238_9BILA|nr:hypothetical protein WR25_00454 [Diploscapter pachys]